MGTSLQQTILAALAAARSTGQPMIIPNTGGMLALPNGQTRVAQPGEIGPVTRGPAFGPVPTAGPSVPVGTPPALSAPSPGFQLGANVGTPIPPASWFSTPAAAPTPSVTLAPVNVTATRLPPDPATAARNYRLAHGLGTAADRLTVDQLNQESLAAAQAGRTYLNPQLAAQYGQAWGQPGMGPMPDVVNALQMPPAAVPVANSNALAPSGGWNLHWLQGLAGPSGAPDGSGGGTA